MPRSQSPVICFAPYRDQWKPDDADPIERISPVFPEVLEQVLSMRAARLIIGRRGSLSLIQLMLVGVNAVHACRAPANFKRLSEDHAHLQYVYRSSPNSETAQRRQEATPVHALNQLEALLVLGYSASVGKPYISKALLRPFADALVPRRGLIGTELELEFQNWTDELRKRISRMRGKLPPVGEDSLNARASAALQKVDTFLRKTGKFPRPLPIHRIRRPA